MKKLRSPRLFFKKTQGFTLIELLIVISIIAIISVIGVAVYTTVLIKARDTARMGNVQALYKAFSLYRGTTGQFPANSGTHCIGIPSSQTCWGDRNVLGSDSLITDISPYLQGFPKDPQPSRGWGDTYLYVDGQTPIGCSANQMPGKYILWRPEKQPANNNDCQGAGFFSCCSGGGGPCGNNGGYYCAYKLE